MILIYCGGAGQVCIPYKHRSVVSPMPGLTCSCMVLRKRKYYCREKDPSKISLSRMIGR